MFLPLPCCGLLRCARPLRLGRGTVCWVCPLPRLLCRLLGSPAAAHRRPLCCCPCLACRVPEGRMHRVGSPLEEELEGAGSAGRRVRRNRRRVAGEVDRDLELLGGWAGGARADGSAEGVLGGCFGCRGRAWGGPLLSGMQCREGAFAAWAGALARGLQGWAVALLSAIAVRALTLKHNDRSTLPGHAQHCKSAAAARAPPPLQARGLA